MSRIPKSWISRSIQLTLCSLIGLSVNRLEAQQAKLAASFLETNCADCHDGSDGEGGFDIGSLDESLADEDAVEKWARVYDRIASGEMPPPDESSLSEKDRDRFLKTAGQWLRETQSQHFQQLGRVRGRRLTNLQLERTLHDLLGIDIPLETLMSDELKDEGFKNAVSAQSMSHFQLDQHLNVVDVALDEAFRRVSGGGGDESEKTLAAEDIVRRKARSRTREPELIDGHAVTWSSGMMYYGRLPATTARESGWYRFTVNVKSLKQPDEHGVWCTVRKGRCVSSAPLLGWVTSFEATEKPRTITFETWLPESEMLEIRPGDETLKKARFSGGQVGTGEGGPQNVPGVAIKSIKMERIHRNGKDDVVRKLLIGDLQVKPGRKNEPGTIESRNPRLDCEKLMVAFATRAFRRPVSSAGIADYVSHVNQLLSQGTEFQSALRTGYRALLCSPRFMYFQEQPGKLDDYAFASRISYFLWNRMPDEELLQLASQGKLRNASVLRNQIDRLLNDPRGKSFVKDFAEDWLDLDLIDFTQPDRKLYPGFDIVVQQSMLDETHATLQHMIDNDLGVSNIIDSRFTHLNERLARFYGVEGVAGDELQKVELKPDHHRGGLMTQGAVLKVTANGTTTSPVIRGAWVAERLLGMHVPPPPANVPAIEPDIRGAKTIREMLDKHKADQSCAICHVKIDPPGFALENFDPSGRWREMYPGAKRLKKEDRERLRVDTSSSLPDGRKFKDLNEFRKLILADEESLAKNLVEKLLIYATGAKVSFADRAQVKLIVAKAKDTDYGFRSIIQEIVASEVFGTK